MDDGKTTTSRIPTSQGHSKSSILSGIREMVMSIFEGGISERYDQTTKRKMSIFGTNQKLRNSGHVCAH